MDYSELIGKRFGSWTIMEKSTKSKHGKSRYLCRCECGTDHIVIVGNILSGLSQRCKYCGYKATTKHGDSDTALHQCWRDIKQRCLNPKCREWKNYGGRGITICEEWKNSYITFKNDMVSSYSPELRIERIDNNKGYYKENCTWVSQKIQNRNMRHNRYIDTVYGNMLLVDAAELFDILPTTLRSRLRREVSKELLLYKGRIPSHGKTEHFNPTTL